MYVCFVYLQSEMFSAQPTLPSPEAGYYSPNATTPGNIACLHLYTIVVTLCFNFVLHNLIGHIVPNINP